MTAEWAVEGAPQAPRTSSLSPWARTFRVAAIREILALHYLLHDVVRVDARVVHPRRVALHRVLLPPAGTVTGQRCQ